MAEAEQLARVLRTLAEIYTDLGCKLIANELVTAKLMKEMAALSPDPPQFLLRVSSEVSGLAEKLAIANREISPEICDIALITRYIHRLCEMAEC